MMGYVRWKDIRAEYVGRADGEEAVEPGEQEFLAEIQGHRRAKVTAEGKV
ncbi:hypothetical protein AB0L65_05050 [Nonomuraea sp. NPDC052116]